MRTDDPRRASWEHVAKRMGHRSSSGLARSDDRVERYNDGERKRNVYTTHTLPTYYREDIGASGDAAYTVRLSTPSATTTWGETALATKMPKAGKVVGGYLWSSAARSGGTATLRVRVTEGGVSTDYDLTDCVLNATDTQAASAWLPYSKGIPFSDAATVDLRIVTAGTWAPTTADAGCAAVVAFEEAL